MGAPIAGHLAAAGHSVQAWNRGTRERVVLIFESFHPDLSAPERRAIEHSYALRGRWLAERRIPPPPSGRHPDAPR